MKKFKLKKNINNQINNLIYARGLPDDSIINRINILVVYLTSGLTRTATWNIMYNSTKALSRGLIRRIFTNDFQKNFKRKKNK